MGWAEIRIGGGRRRWRYERHRKSGARGVELARSGTDQRHLDLPDQTSGLWIDQADAVRAILPQPALGRAGDDQARKRNQADASKPSGIDNFQDRGIGVVEFPPE